MAKVTLFLLTTIFFLQGSDKIAPPELERECLRCHTAQKIPSEAIYRRYLLKYSSKEMIRGKMFSFLRSPSVKKSIMPPQFFSKFSLTGRSELNDATLRQRIDAYVDYFDVNPRLYVLPEKN
jgi:hypothetical protein